MNANDFTSVNHILADVLLEVDDEYLDKGYTKGWYISQIQQAMEELSFDTFFDERTQDFDYPDENAMLLPKDCFNIREVYLHDGNCCNVDSSAIVHPKRLFNNKPKGDGSTSLRKDASDDTDIIRDPIYPSDSSTVNDRNVKETNLYYYNIQNGQIMFSSNSSGWAKVRLVYNGMGGEIGDAPVVPRFFRQAVKDFCIEKFWRAQKSKTNAPRSARLNWSDVNNMMQKSWRDARIRISSMDTREREAMREYYAHGGW